jgi:RHS repeat-associated protein
MKSHRPLLVVATVISLVISIHAQNQHKNQERGFSPNGIYSGFDIDNINLFSGNLVVAIPIGQTYPVGGQLSYSMALVYNSNLWSQREVCTEGVDLSYALFTTWVNYRLLPGGGIVRTWESPPQTDDPSPNAPGVSRGSDDGCYTMQYPNPAANAGMGWQLTFGRIYNPNRDVYSLKDRMTTTEKHDYVYQSPDGSEHTFYPTLHEGETPVANTFYSRDGSYLRMTISNGVYEIEFPNGVIHTFGPSSNGMGESEIRVTRMRDQFNNEVNITYTATQWTIRDSVGRRHTVNLAPKAPDYPNVVTSVSFEAFNGSTDHYFFDYFTKADLPRAQPHVDPSVVSISTNEVNVPFLTSVKLPDNSQYLMPEQPETNQNGVETAPAAYDYTGEFSSLRSTGVLRRIVVPAGGSIEWQYRGVSESDDLTHHYGYPLISSARNYMRWSTGVRKRIVTEGSHRYVWTFTPTPERAPLVGANGENCSRVNGEWWTAPCAPKLFTNEVRTPEGNLIKNYFSFYPHPFDNTAGRDTSAWHVVEYGLPMNKSVKIASDNYGRPLFLSTQIFNSSGTLMRSTYVRYETDQWPAADGFGNLAETNARLEAVRTVYNDDCGGSAVPCAATNSATKYKEVQYTDYDGLGHYRKTEFFSNFGSGDRRLEMTNYNAGNGTYKVDAATNRPASGHNYVPFPTSRPWVLGTYDFTLAGDFIKRTTTYYKFNQRGSLLAKRLRKDLETANTPMVLSAQDVLLNYTYDDNGNLTSESYFGGDGQGNLRMDVTFPTLSDSSSEYKINYGYRQCQKPDGTLGTLGVISNMTYRAPINQTGFKSQDKTIDCSTGLVQSSRDSAEVETQYQYTSMGRIAYINRKDPGADQSNRGNYDKFIYEPHNTANAGLPKATVQRWAHDNNGTVNENDVNQLLAEEIYIYDQLGRLTTEKKRLSDIGSAGSLYQARNTNYTGSGWVTDVSEWIPETSQGMKTIYDNFDPFGRPGKISQPDNNASNSHFITMGYTGERLTTRSVRIGYQATSTGVVNEQESTTKEFYDGQGRLFQVQEPSTSTGLTTWTYEYNVNSKLTKVSTTDPATGIAQTRNFNYDNLGHLRSENNPERASMTFDSYDTMGNLLSSFDGIHTLSYVYDFAGRPLSIREAAGTPSGRALKDYTYYSENNLAVNGASALSGNKGKGKMASATRHNWVGNPYRQNVALSANGATATASSTNTTAGTFDPRFTIDGRRSGSQWGVDGGWNDGTPNTWPDWLQVQFAGSKTIDTINVFSVQDNYASPVEPTASQTFTKYGLIDFQVQYWNGSGWATVSGGNIVGNNLVRRQIKLSQPITTDKIRVFVNRGGDTWSRITEVEAIEAPAEYQPEVDVRVTEEYIYTGRDGMLGKQVTKLNSSLATPPTFEQSFGYDQLGNLQSQVYPQCVNTTCRNSQNGAAPRPWRANYLYRNGWIVDVGGGAGVNNTNGLSLTDMASARYATRISYQSNGMTNGIAHTNGVTDSYAQDPYLMKRIAGVRVAKGTQELWNSGTYSYDGAGNITKVGADWYLYDKVNRVVEGSSLSAGMKRRYTYDAFGNIMNRNTYAGVTTPTNGYVIEPFDNNVRSEKNQLALYYDGAGNASGVLSATAGQSPTIYYTYDAMNMIKYAPGFTYIYGPTDERVWMVDRQDAVQINGTITLRGLNNEVLREYLLLGSDESGNWRWNKDYIYSESKLLASETPTGTRHYHLDHLGTSRLITDANGNTLGGPFQYFPFGEDVFSPPPDERLRFTGHERDPDGLDYMHARFYRQGNGKFLSVDPGRDWDIKQPQSWNLYAYARNNPVNNADPTGRFTGAAPLLMNRMAPVFECSAALRAMNKDFKALQRALKYKSELQEAAENNQIDWRVLASIGIRESGFRNVGETATKKSKGGQGVFQIDVDSHKGADKWAYDVSKAADYAAGLIKEGMDRYGNNPLGELGSLRYYNAGNGKKKYGYDLVLKKMKGGTPSLDRGSAGDNYVSTVHNLANSCYGPW